MGLKKEKPKARFSKMFHIIVLSFLGAMLYSVTPFFMLVYLLPTVTGTISLFYRDNAVCLATDANFSLEVSNSIVENNEEPKVETITEIKVSNKKEQNDFESKIVFLKNLRDKDLIDEEEYKREVSKILSEI